jgi:hypothetical protein
MLPSTTHLGLSDTGGLDFVVSKMRKGTEPLLTSTSRTTSSSLSSLEVIALTLGQAVEVAPDDSMSLPKGEQRTHPLPHHSKTPARTQRCDC